MEGGPSCFPRGSTCPAVLGIPSRSHYSFGYKAVTFCGGPFQAASARPAVCNCARALQRSEYDSHNPMLKTAVTLQQHGLGYSPFARRYLGNRGFFLFLGVLRCFSSPGCLDQPMDSVGRNWILLQLGCPIRRSPVQGLLAAPRGFSQLTASFFVS